MIYLKEFSTENDYVAYRDGKDYLKPNVSLSGDKEIVYYNYTPKPKANGHDYVDLGLSSGTLWASMNVGASKPSDEGLYFQWGDTVGYAKDQIGKDKQFNWANYKWNPSGDGETFTKYQTSGATLDLVDDAANKNMGGDWHMPSPEQIQELIDNTISTWTTSNGTGMTFTSKNNGNSIFFPAAGYAWDGSISSSGSYGYVWSSMLDTYKVNEGQGLRFYSSIAYQAYNYRFNGLSVRGVLG